MSRQAKLLLVVGSVAYFVGCSSEGNRKIKLSSDSDNATGVQTASSVLQVGPEDQRNIAILFFENETGDANLDWLRRGLTEMLTTDLTQSRDLNVVTVQRLQELLARQVEEVPNNIDVSLAIKVARDAEIESILTGRIYTEGGELFIEVELRDAKTGKLLRRESVNSSGMEQIFSMVNDLSRRVRTSLRGDLVAETEREFQLTDMTKSLEAYRCYSEALENSEKFLLAEAEKCLKDAVKSDSTFAAAYLQLAILKFKQHNVEEAVQSMEKARLYAHKLSEVDQIRLKLMESKHGDDVESYLAALEEFLSYTPYDSETRMQLAGTYLELKQYDKALEEYEAVLELDPKRKLAHNQLGYVYAYRGDFATALKHIDKYAEASPGEPNPHDSRGQILIMAGRLQEAITHFETALSIRPDFHYSAENLVNVYGEVGALKDGLANSDLVIKLAQNDRAKGNAYTNRARLLWRFGKIEEAENEIKRAQDLQPRSIYPMLVAREMYLSESDTVAANELSWSFFEKHLEAVTSREWSDDEIAGFLVFSMEARLPQSQVIPMLENLMQSETQAYRKELYRYFLAISHLREGSSEKAREFFEDNGAKYLQLLVALPNRGWNSANWKYVSESIDLEPRDMAPDYTFCTQMLEAAKKAGRKDIEVIARYIFAQSYGKHDKKDRMAAEYKGLGTPLEEDWRVIGPFQNRSGFDGVFEPESELDFTRDYSTMDGDRMWQPAVDGSYDGYVNLRKIFGRSSWAVAYAAVAVHSPDDRVVQLRIGTDESFKLWLNGDLVSQAYRQYDAPLDNDIVKVMLRPGDNHLLLKVTNSIREWGFYLRVTDGNGDGFEDILFHPPGEVVEQEVVMK